MDQVKVVLAAIKKHHFWVLCGVIVVLVLGAWWSATSGLAKSIETRKVELESAQKSVQGVTSESLHANKECIGAIQAEHEKLRNEVYNAWDFLYRVQKRNSVWPPIAPNFRRDIELLGPDDEIQVKYRDLYMYFIQRHLPRMYEIVDLRLPAKRDPKGMIITDENGKPVKIDPFETGPGKNYAATTEYGGAGMADGMEGSGGYSPTVSSREELVGKVDWSMSDLKRIRSGYYWKTRPTTTQVRLAQEDLWVYEALLRIIAKTNETATSHYSAAVKSIQALEIGQKAAGAFAQSRVSGARAGAMGGSGGSDEDMYGEGGSGGMGAEMGAMPGPGMGMGMGGMPDESGMGGSMSGGAGRGGGLATAGSIEERIKSQLINFRYVDQNGMPLAASASPPFAEFKMMPVRMALVVDQRRIANLLINCANSPMPVVVWQVGLNPGKGGTLNLGTAGSGMGGAYGSAFGGGLGGMSGMGSADMYGEDGGGSAYTGGGPMGQNRGQQATYDIPIEIQGIIYIFNPPDREKLGTGSAGEETPMPPSGAPAIPPADVPAIPPAGAPATPPATAPGMPPAATPAVPPAGAPAMPPAGTPAAPPAGAPATPPAAAPGMPPAGTPAVPPAGAPAAPPAGAPAATPTASATPPAAGGGNP